jgi:biopolymer transport protein ExbD
MPSPLHVPRKRRFVFMLTPLVDVMFLLLIFFMLSSQTAPYSLLELLGAAPPQPAGDAPTPAPQPIAGRGDLIVSIGHGFVRFNGERVELADIKPAIERFMAAGFSNAVLLPSRTSTVQDVVSVLESFEATAFGNAKLMTTAAN